MNRAPTFLQASARSSGPNAFVRIARCWSNSQPSTSVQAAQLITTSGDCDSIVARTADSSLMSRALRSSPVTSSPAVVNDDTAARPTKPPAPVTITFKALQPRFRTAARRIHDRRRYEPARPNRHSFDTTRSFSQVRFPTSLVAANLIRIRSVMNQSRNDDRDLDDL